MSEEREREEQAVDGEEPVDGTEQTQQNGSDDGPTTGPLHDKPEEQQNHEESGVNGQVILIIFTDSTSGVGNFDDGEGHCISALTGEGHILSHKCSKNSRSTSSKCVAARHILSL